MENTKLTIFKNSVNYGIILGFTLIIISVISYLSGTMDSKTGQTISSYFQYAIIIIGIILGTKFLRTSSGGFISYGRALGSGTLICVFASVILAIYMYIFLRFIDTNAIKKMIEIAEQNISERGLPDEQIESSMIIIRKTMTPFLLSFATIWTFSFLGFIFSLLTSIFLQKKGSTIPWTVQTENPNVENNTKPDETVTNQPGIEENKTGETHN